MEVSERIKQFTQWKGVTVSAFERTCGFSHGYVNGIRRRPSDKACATIALRFPELSIRWMLSGRGAMLTPEASPAGLESSERTRFEDMLRSRDERILELETIVLAQQREIDKLREDAFYTI